MKPKRNSSRRGNALVESALTLSLFLTILFSIYDFGWTLFLHQTLIHRARAGARYAAINPGDLLGARNLVLYDQNTAVQTALAVAGTAGTFGVLPANVTVTRNGTAGSTEDRIHVNISGYHFVFITFGWAGTHNGRAIDVSVPVEN
jgi:Flp pilus assembly protein TadG